MSPLFLFICENFAVFLRRLKIFSFFELWHVARLLPFSATDVQKLQQLGVAFINRYAKLTRFAFSTLCLPDSQGGLSLIDPEKQINALQWCWLHPFLHSSDGTSSAVKSSLLYLRVLLYFTSEFSSTSSSLLHYRSIPPMTTGLFSFLLAALHAQRLSYLLSTTSSGLLIPLFVSLAYVMSHLVLVYVYRFRLF
ncbi:hypothetical protein HMPREF1544_02466 [Mucor circinelloides 1006PhL]|uniref:Uncharacterized protein n=1 Tax=Mucor circinelloides f. circinelloides (strain 1006PhL) TaxID=1220926 RepID=S2JK54_MUCC1|nr:hypothetical protein HMPREF1544_02466 [Mucor circinelloides 1006PhL]